MKLEHSKTGHPRYLNVAGVTQLTDIRVADTLRREPLEMTGYCGHASGSIGDCSRRGGSGRLPVVVEQAKKLDKMLAKTGDSVNLVMALEVPDSILEERICGRWIHKKSGASYHVIHKPPASMEKSLEKSTADVFIPFDIVTGYLFRVSSDFERL